METQISKTDDFETFKILVKHYLEEIENVPMCKEDCDQNNVAMLESLIRSYFEN